MTAPVRRILIWVVVAAFFATAIRGAIAGEPLMLVAFSGFPVVGAIILTSRPRNGVGWYLWGIGAWGVLTGWSIDPQVSALAPAWLESVTLMLATPVWILLPVVGLLFPRGHIETRLGVVLAWVIGGFAALSAVGALLSDQPLTSGRPNPFAVVLPVGWELVFNSMFAALAVAYVGVVVDLVRRWRVADAVARAQYRWFCFGLAVLVSLIGLASASGLVPAIEQAVQPTRWLVLFMINLVPITIGVAITRHGLYEIGRVVSRTVSYATVTLLAIGVYAFVVTSVSLLLPDQSALPVALATLAAAAAFLPALRWVQRLLDRRFDRERYDAEKVVDAFGQRLRDGADPVSATPELVGAVEHALQPASVGLWTAGGSR